MTIAEFLSLLEEVVEAEQGSVHPDLGLDEIGWDSIAHLSMIAEIDRRVGVAIDSGALSKARTVGDVFECITAS